jgi:hypothetical protein
MDSQENPTTTKYQQVTVDVPEDRVAEFHAFFGRFLAGRVGRGRRGGFGRHHRGGHGGHHRGGHGRRCSERREAAEGGGATEQATGITEV